MIVGITGHRPTGIGGFSIPNPIYNRVKQQITESFIESKPDKIITGMALGTDTLAANIAIELGIPFIAAVPFKEQPSRWPFSSKQIYEKLLEKAERVVIIGELATNNFNELMQLRNKWIVDNSDRLLAVWSGEFKGGTFNCVTYAQSKKNYPIYIIRPSI
jgi:uncharacterized phage-like protein YoqJ